MPVNDLNAQLLRAHDTGDLTSLVALYTEAGDRTEADGDIKGCCFYLTHAFVFALEQGDIRADALNARLAEYGCDPRLTF